MDNPKLVPPGQPQRISMVELWILFLWLHFLQSPHSLALSPSFIFKALCSDICRLPSISVLTKHGRLHLENTQIWNLVIPKAAFIFLSAKGIYLLTVLSSFQVMLEQLENYLRPWAGQPEVRGTFLGLLPKEWRPEKTEQQGDRDPSEELVAFSRVLIEMVMKRAFWPHDLSLQGKKSLLYHLRPTQEDRISCDWIHFNFRTHTQRLFCWGKVIEMSRRTTSLIMNLPFSAFALGQEGIGACFYCH